MQGQQAAEPEAAFGNFSVRPARLDDAEALARLSVQLGYPSSRQQVERRLTSLLGQPGDAVFVAETTGPGSGVVAWIHGSVRSLVESDPTVEIGGLVVEEGYQGRGAGRVLLEHVERWARNAGCATVTVRSNVVREGAHVFYQRLGYNAVKTQRVFRKNVAS